MNVIQLFTIADQTLVTEAHNIAYPKYPLTLEYYRTFLEAIVKKVLIKSDMFVDVNHLVSWHDDPIDDEETIDVSVYTDQTYSMSFVPWGEILAATVRNNAELSMPELAAHIFWEMTWHGMEEDTLEREQELLESVEQFDREMADHKAKIEIGDAEDDSLPNGYRLAEDVFDDLFPNETDDEKMERKARRDRTVANYLTRISVKNGEIVWINGGPVESD